MENDLDIELYQKYLNGEKAAFEMLYNKYKSKIQYFVFNIVRDCGKAEDITQEVFLYILQNRLRENCSLKNYLYLVARSKAYSYINKENKREELNEKYKLIGQDEVQEDVYEIVMKEENRKKLLEAIDELDDKYKNAIYLVKVEEFSYQETAKILRRNA